MGTTYTPPAVSSSGLAIPQYQAYLSYLVNLFLSTYGTTNYLGADSVDYQDIAIRALQSSDLAQALQATWLSFNPLTAIGVSLDLLGKLIGTSRNASSYSTVTLTVNGTPGTVITSGFAEDLTGNYWALPSTVTIPSGGSINVTATAKNPGNITANPNTIVDIATPTAGWLSVNNGAAAVAGSPVEPDSSYRARLLLSQTKPSLSLLAGTAAAIAAVPGVTRSQVYENQYGYTASIGLISTSGTSFTIVNGYPLDSSDVSQTININGSNYTIATVATGSTGTLSTSAGTQTEVPYYVGSALSLGPAHSITSIVENGTSAAIAQAIYNNKNPGVLTNGTTAVPVIDPSNGNISIDIAFNVLSYVQIYVSYSVLPLTGYTSATTAAIEADVLAYLNSLGIGESVIYSSLWGAALQAITNPSQPLFSIKSVTSGYQVVQTTGNTTSTSASVPVTSTASIAASQVVVGNGIPNNTTVSSVGNAAAITIHAAGAGYTTATGLPTTGGSGTGLTVNITASGGNITAATIASAGSGYVAGDIVAVTQGGASGGQLNITSAAIAISAAATATASGVELAFFSVGTTDIQVNYTSAAQGQEQNVVVTVI